MKASIDPICIGDNVKIYHTKEQNDIGICSGKPNNRVNAINYL